VYELLNIEIEKTRIQHVSRIYFKNENAGIREVGGVKCFEKFIKHQYSVFQTSYVSPDARLEHIYHSI